MLSEDLQKLQHNGPPQIVANMSSPSVEERTNDFNISFRAHDWDVKMFLKCTLMCAKPVGFNNTAVAGCPSLLALPVQDEVKKHLLAITIVCNVPMFRH